MGLPLICVIFYTENFTIVISKSTKHRLLASTCKYWESYICILISLNLLRQCCSRCLMKCAKIWIVREIQRKV